MNERLLIDTDVLIDHLRSNSQKGRMPFAPTKYAGVREGKERTALDNFITAFEIIPIDEKIATLGDLYRRDYGKSHGVGLADALIAATANIKQAKLVTLNRKHFPMLTDLIIPDQKG